MTSSQDPKRQAEVQEKLAWLRGQLPLYAAAAIRFRGSDWFAWITAGGSNVVLLAAETGVAEVLITADVAVILTDAIEVERLQEEQVPEGFTWHIAPWTELAERELFVKEVTGGGKVLSDRPAVGEEVLPDAFQRHRLSLSDSEQARYRKVGLLAAAAMSEVMDAAVPTWTEYELAGAGARALWARGLHPALVLAAGAERLARYRHPTPTAAKLGDIAMLVFCARGYGLYANLTRFVYFTSLSREQRRQQDIIRTIEADGLFSCRPGSTLAQVYIALAQAYRAQTYPTAISQHHQGGITGYLAREVIATPATAIPLEVGMAIALNPSLPGVKIEDTFLLQAAGLENLTLHLDWPTVVHDGRLRPLPLER